MDVTLYVSEERYDEILEKGFPSSLGKFSHNIAVMIMAYDTGNARSAITLSHNTPTRFTIDYNLLKANYIKFLDDGVGPVKKHKGIVSSLTFGAIGEEVMNWVLTGNEPTFTSPPVVALRQSKYRPFGAKSSVTGLSEKDVLRSAGMTTNAISPQARREVSKVREYAYTRYAGGKAISKRGQSTETTHLQGHTRLASNKNLSILKAVAQDQKRKYKEHRERTNDLINMRGV